MVLVHDCSVFIFGPPFLELEFRGGRWCVRDARGRVLGWLVAVEA